MRRLHHFTALLVTTASLSSASCNSCTRYQFVATYPTIGASIFPGIYRQIQQEREERKNQEIATKKVEINQCVQDIKAYNKLFDEKKQQGQRPDYSCPVYLYLIASEDDQIDSCTKKLGALKHILAAKDIWQIIMQADNKLSKQDLKKFRSKLEQLQNAVAKITTQAMFEPSMQKILKELLAMQWEYADGTVINPNAETVFSFKLFVQNYDDFMMYNIGIPKDKVIELRCKLK